jgi:hypothetical protein
MYKWCDVIRLFNVEWHIAKLAKSYNGCTLELEGEDYKVLKTSSDQPEEIVLSGTLESLFAMFGG